MKRKELTYEELDKVIRLRKFGTSWLKIEHETGITRRTAKRAYEKWMHSQSPEILRKAREDVAAKAFLDHLKSLTTLAGSLVMNLSVPSSPDMMTKNAEQFFSELWHQDLLLRWNYPMPSETRVYYLIVQEQKRDMQFNFRENQLLFKCLQDHTRGEGVRWEALNQWSKARDTCVKVLPKLRKETSVVVNNFLNQETNLLLRVKEESLERRGGNAVEQMAAAVLSALWQDILEDKPEQIFVRVLSRSEGQGIVEVKVKQVGAIIAYEETFLKFNDTSLAKKVVHTCNLAVDNLRKGEKAHIVKSLQDEVRIMKDATEELREMLNPIKLTPMILRTWCDLCPA